MGVDFAQGYGVCRPSPLFESAAIAATAALPAPVGADLGCVEACASDCRLVRERRRALRSNPCARPQCAGLVAAVLRQRGKKTESAYTGM